MSTSGACMNSGEFPTFRLLVVDDDTFYLNNLEQTLKKCQYEGIQYSLNYFNAILLLSSILIFYFFLNFEGFWEKYVSLDRVKI